MENHMQVSEPSAKYMVKAAEYKQTEAGHIPADWRLGRLADVAQIRSGITKNSKAAIDNPVSVHYLRVANVQDGYLDLSDMSQLLVSQSDIKRHEVLPGDMLMNEGGDLDKLGRGALWRGKFSPCIHQNHVFVVRSGPQLIPEYLQAWTGSASAKNYFMLAGRQTTNLASINKTALGQLPIPLPTIEEQQAIATALSDTDALIDALEQLLAKKRQVKQGVLQELLTGNRRAFENPSQAAKKRVADVCHMKSGSTITAENLSDHAAFRCFGGNGLRGYTSTYTHDGNYALIGRQGALCGNVFYASGKFFASEHAIVVTPKIGTDIRWLAHILRRLNLNQYSESSAQPGLSVSKILSLPIQTPSLQEQTAIAAILSDMDTDITDLETRLGKVRQVKQGMMRELLTGRTRLV